MSQDVVEKCVRDLDSCLTSLTDVPCVVNSFAGFDLVCSP